MAFSFLFINRSFIKDNDECYLYVFDKKTKKPILNGHVFSKENEFVTNGNKVFAQNQIQFRNKLNEASFWYYELGLN